MGVNIQPGQAERTLYDRYSSLLQDPTQGMQNPATQFALREAQQANQRQLAAGRMRNSGRALREMSDVTTGTLMQQFGNLANIYRGGAETETGRYTANIQPWMQAQGMNLDALKSGEALGLDAQKLKLAALQGAGDLALRAGQTYTNEGDLALRARALDLQRAQANIMTPNQQQASDIRSTALSQANQPSSYGTYSPSLSQQYLNLTGTPLTLNYMSPGQGSQWGINAQPTGWYR
jgi:hypothetical protein